MPTWAKVLLTIVAIGIALFIAVGFVGYHWFMKNKDQLMAARNEGVTYGKGVDTGACVDEALKKLGGGLTSQINAKLFVEGCFTTAKPSPALCSEVPPPSEIMRAAQWGVNECRKRGVTDQQGCSQVMQSVVQYCQKQR